jgi:hypothetical protein
VDEEQAAERLNRNIHQSSWLCPSRKDELEEFKTMVLV